MRAFKTKSFARLARQEGVGDAVLRKAIERAEQGLIDADLGGNVIKQRVGLRGSHRILVLYRAGHLAFFAFVFAKNTRANVSRKELEALQDAAETFLAYAPADIARALKERTLIEVDLDDENDDEA